MAIVRGHGSWMQQYERQVATNAKDLAPSLVSWAGFWEPQPEPVYSVTEVALVIGVGVARIQVVLDLADGGHQVYLVEKKLTVGGTVAVLGRLCSTMRGNCSCNNFWCLNTFEDTRRRKNHRP